MPDVVQELVFLQRCHPPDEVAVFRQRRVGGGETRQRGVHHLGQKRPVQPQLPPVAYRPPDDAAQHIPPLAVGRRHPVADEKRRRPGVFRHHANGVVVAGVRPVLPPGYPAHRLYDGPEKVGFINIAFALQHGGGAFQAHAGVHAGRRQRRADAFQILVELHKHQVPQLHEPFAVAVGMAAARFGGRAALGFLPQHCRQLVRRQHGVGVPVLADALFGAAVVMQLRAGAGGPFPAGRPPPVVAVAIAVDAFRRHAYVVAPQRVGIVIVQMDGDIHTLRRQPEGAGAELPGKSHRIPFEIVANAEIAQHFKESEMLVVAHLVNVGGAEGFLAAGQPAAGRRAFPHKEGLERHHSRRSEQQRRVAGRDQRRRRHRQMPPFLKKAAERIADAVAVRSVHRDCDSVAVGYGGRVWKWDMQIVGLAPRQGQQLRRQASRDGTLCDMRYAQLALGGPGAQKLN